MSALFRRIEKRFLIKLPGIKKRTIAVPLPKNLNDPEDFIRFQNNSWYFLPDLKIKKISQCHIYLNEFNGLVLKNFNIDKHSSHALTGDSRMPDIYMERYFRSHELLLHSKFGKDREIYIPDAHKKYVLIHDWFNYFHWTCETLVRLWKGIELVKTHWVLLPEKILDYPFVSESLKLLEIENIETVPSACEIVYLSELTLIQNAPYNNNFNPHLLFPLADRLRDSVNIVNPLGKAEKIFISRQKAPMRRFSNYDSVEEILKQFGFQSIFLEDYSLPEQIAIMKDTKYLIAMHGAGLANVIFMPPGGKVLEMHRVLKNANDHHNIVYWRLSSIMQHTYYWMMVDPDPLEKETFYLNQALTRDYVVNISELEKNIRLMIQS